MEEFINMAEKIIESSAIKMYEQDQSKYSIVVNRRRMIPEIRDGLIPVQRRVIFAAYKDHLTSPKMKDKSASLLGSTMKYYHPHGNCLHSSTKLYNADTNSTITIGELYEKHIESINIYAVDTKTGNICIATAHSFRIGQIADEQFTIKLSNGGSVVCTENHPFLTTDMKWVKAKDIKIGMELFTWFSNGKWERPIHVADIYRDLVESVPYYDFTVDELENMLIPVGSDECIYSEKTFICIHNSSIYGAIANLAVWYRTKYPIFYGKGNWGNVMGAGPAAERYTECALSNFGYDILIDELAQSNNIIDWIDTYKRNGDKEPEYLPSKLPLILINGAFGIGVGMSINVPSHNLVEVVEATRQLIVDPKSEIVLIPDQCQACTLFDTDWKEICDTGRGSFKVRGNIVTQTDKKGNVTLHIVSLPDGVNTTMVYEKILKMVEAKQMPMIKDIFNSLTNEKPDIVIHLKQGADPEYVKQAIYAKTPVQSTVSVNFEAVTADGINIKRFSYKEYLLSFIDQRMNMKFRLYCNKLQQVLTRHHQVDAFIKVLESGEIDNIINLIRKEKSTDENKIVEYIIKKCNVTDVQAKFIIGCNIGRLSLGHLNGYREERKKLLVEIKEYETRVTDKDGKLIKQEIYDELGELAAKYNSPRLCKVAKISDENDIPQGTFKIVITERNYIRKIPDIDKIGIIKKDNPKFILKVDNTENILIFDNKGKVFNVPVSKIPITDRSGSGTDVRILVKNLTSDIIAVFYEPIFKKIAKSGNKHYLTVLTRFNMIKKIDIEDFLTVNQSGLIYSKIKDEDEVVGVSLVPHNLDIAICSGHKVLRTSLKNIPLVKRNAIGCNAMDSTEPINGLSVIYPDASHIVVLTKNGFFNKFDSALLTSHARYCKGNGVIKLGSNDEIFNIFGVNDLDKIRVVTSEGIEEVAVTDIPNKSSIAAGKKMLLTKGIIIRADIVR
jgi:DNA gyrase subunit A